MNIQYGIGNVAVTNKNIAQLCTLLQKLFLSLFRLIVLVSFCSHHEPCIQ